MDEHTDGLTGPVRQIKSKERVATHGEVFTAPREVNAMLDLVKPETERQWQLLSGDPAPEIGRSRQSLRKVPQRIWAV